MDLRPLPRFHQSTAGTLFAVSLLLIFFGIRSMAEPLQCNDIFPSTRSHREIPKDVLLLENQMETFLNGTRILNPSKVFSISAQILKIMPDHYDARMKYILSAMSLGRLKEAHQELTLALKEDPENTNLNILLAKTLSKIPADERNENPKKIAENLYRKGSLKESEWGHLGSLSLWLRDKKLLEKIISKMKSEHPNSEKILKLELELLRIEERDQELLDKSEHLTEGQQKDFEIIELRARALQHTNKLMEALTLIENNIPEDQRPSSLDFLYSDVLFSLRRPQEALVSIDRALSRKKIPNRHFLKLRYKILKVLRMYDESIALLNSMKQLYPQDQFSVGAMIETQFLKASSLESSKPEQSAQLFEETYQLTLKAAQGSSNNEFYMKYQARTLIKMQRYEDALVVLNDLIKNGKNVSDYEDLAVICYLHLDQFDKALVSSQKLFQLFPKDPVILGHLATSLIGLGRYQEAASRLEQGILSGISDNFNWINLARAYEKMGELSKALEILETIQKLEPNNMFIQNKINRILTKQYKEKK